MKKLDKCVDVFLAFAVCVGISILAGGEFWIG